MIKFNKPNSLNSNQLLKEFKSARIAVLDERNFAELDGDGVLWLSITETDKSKATQIVDSHKGVDDDCIAALASAQAKLAALGLTEEEVASILG